MSLPSVDYDSAYHSRYIPFIGDYGSIDRVAHEKTLPRPEVFVGSDLTNVTPGADGVTIKAHRGVDCQMMTDADCEIVVESVLKAKAAQNFKVSTISLRNHNIKDEGAEKLAELVKGAKGGVGVTSLDLYGNDIGTAGCAALCEVLKDNEILASLNLSENPIGRGGGYAIAEMLELNGSIQRLEVGCCDLSTPNLIAIMSVMRKNELVERLALYNCRNFSRQEDLSMHTTRMLEFNKNLIDLDFSRNGVGDEGARMFSWVLEKKNSTLRHLNLSGNKIGVVGAESLASLLIRRSSLISLNLSNNKVGDDGAKAFGAALASNKSLRSLNLKSNSLKDSGLVAIALGMQENSTLSELKLWGNEFGQDSCSEFLALVESRFDYFGVSVDFCPFVSGGEHSVAESS